MSDIFLCPRRSEIGNSSVFKLPESDKWSLRNGHRVCSYCGSAHPDDVMAAVQNGAEITPTDKNYKIYIDLPSHKHAKAYFQHFTEDHKDRLIEWVNRKWAKFAYPGYFYVLPYFCSRSTAVDK